jgi:hypothetical protein
MSPEAKVETIYDESINIKKDENVLESENKRTPLKKEQKKLILNKISKNNILNKPIFIRKNFIVKILSNEEMKKSNEKNKDKFLFRIQL